MEQTAHLQTVLLHLFFSADPVTEACGCESANADLDRLKKPSSATAPLGEAPFRSRGHSDLRHKGLVGHAHRRLGHVATGRQGTDHDQRQGRARTSPAGVDQCA